MTVEWQGVFPAVTTQFTTAEAVDMEATRAHIDMLIRAGVHGLVMLGTVGENCSLSADEKRAIMQAAVETAAGRVPVLAGVAETTTAQACRFAADVEAIGAQGLMVLPAMVYRSDARETMAHYRAVAQASALPIMCYNNPVTYGVDITPEMFAELGDEPTLVAIKESSDDPRRLTDLVNACGDRYILFGGVDDLVMESVMLGAQGTVAGLVNAFPEETLQLWAMAVQGRYAEALDLYRWFMPVLHLDCHPKLVQYIKLAQALCGYGSETCRAPRLALEGEERARITALIQQAIDTRPGAKAA